MPERRHRQRFEIPGHARFLTFTTQANTPIFANPAIADLFAEHLGRSRDKQQFKLIAWVAMPDHVHLLVLPDLETADVPLILRDLKSRFAMSVLQRWKRMDPPPAVLERLRVADSHRMWLKGGGYDRNIRTRDELREKIRYIHLNPVRAGLVEKPGDYRWSSAAFWDGRSDALVRCDRV